MWHRASSRTAACLGLRSRCPWASRLAAPRRAPPPLPAAPAGAAAVLAPSATRLSSQVAGGPDAAPEPADETGQHGGSPSPFPDLSSASSSGADGSVGAESGGSSSSESSGKREGGSPSPFPDLSSASSSGADGGVAAEGGGSSSGANSGKRKGGSALSSVPLVSKLPTREEFDLRQSFHKFPLRREVQLGLLKMGISVPTRVQDLTVPKLLEGISLFMLAQTGTGKTLAYVAPIVNKLLETNSDSFFPMSRAPRAIIVQPTRELALQTIKVVRSFPVRSVVCAPGCSFIKEAQSLHAGVDIAVGTPYRLILHLGKENMRLNQVRHIVFDEADTLCDTFYEQDSCKLLDGLQEDCPVRPQIVIVGATRTAAVSSFIRRHLGHADMLPLVTTDAHMTPAQVEQVFVPTRGKRLLAVLWDVLAEVPAVGKKTLVFTNRVTSCKAVISGMKEHGINAVALHGNINPKKRAQMYRDFNSGGADVMVCTNLASRGLDFQNVHHVIMYEFPLNLADYLHRVGRTARGGRAGRVTTITPRRYWPFVTKIQEAAREGKPIEVRHSTKRIRRMLAIDKFQKVAQNKRVNKPTRTYFKRLLGLPPARNVGSKETKLAMKKLDRRLTGIKQMRYLWKRGLLKKGYGIPKLPDTQVEKTETQTVSTLTRARDGLLQVVAKRRRKSSEDEPTVEPSPVELSYARGNKPEPRDAMKRRRRPTM